MSICKEKTIIVVDTPGGVQGEWVRRFLFHYLCHPLVRLKSSWISIVNKDVSEVAIMPKVYQWQDVLAAIGNVECSGEAANVLDILEHVLSFVNHDILTAKPRKVPIKYHLVVLSPMIGHWDWHGKFELLASICPKLNSVTFVDMFKQFSDLTTLMSTSHESNVVHINESLIPSNNVNESSICHILYMILSDSISYLTQHNLLTLPTPDVREIYKGPIQIPLCANSVTSNEKLLNLEFNVSMYPLVKSKGLNGYIKNKQLFFDGSPLKLARDYYYWKPEGKDGQSSKQLIEKDQLHEGVRIPSSNYLTSELLAFDPLFDKGIQLYAFIKENKIPPWYLKSESLLVTPTNPMNESDMVKVIKDQHIFQDLMMAMREQEMVALVRIVKKEGLTPTLGILYPRIYIDEKSNEKQDLNRGFFILNHVVFSDDEKLPNLGNSAKYTQVDESLQLEMDKLVSESDLVGDNNLQDMDEFMVTMNEFGGVFDKVENEDDPSFFKDTVADILKKTVSPMAELGCISNAIAWDLVDKLMGDKFNLDENMDIFQLYQNNSQKAKAIMKQSIEERVKYYKGRFEPRLIAKRLVKREEEEEG